jgi:hexosaminidase
MKKNNALLIFGIAWLLVACQLKVELQPVGIIPEPLSIIEKQGKPFIPDSKTRIIIQNELMLPAATLLQDLLKNDIQIVNRNDAGATKNDFVFELNPGLDSLSAEGYKLTIAKSGVLIESAGPQGLFYAVETIRQLLPVEMETDPVQQIALPAVQIIDSPRFPWRGMHLDVSRHFMPLDFVKKYIDYIAMHKLNVFHWHLVDGIGWRIEIKSHPELTDIGAWRVVKEGKQPWQDFEVWRAGDERPKYGGFYTQEEIKEVVAYAKERYITVLPEIELPGHSEAILQCFPDLVCKDSHGKSLDNIGVFCASNPDSYTILEDILDEVLELFPSEYIHIGGDEVSKSNWEKCAACRQTMKKNGSTPHELQSDFVNHFDGYLKSKGRKLIGWHEILEGKLSESATIMYWGGENEVAEYLRRGHPTVLTTGSVFYFDHYQSLSKHEPKAFGGYAPLKKVYMYEPVPDNLEPEFADLILGVQANIWTEYVDNYKHAEYMTMPRMAALSEVAWRTPVKRDWEHFRVKVANLMKRYDAMGVNYAKSAFRPGILLKLNKETKNIEVTLETELITDIYYTTDGSEPTVDSGVKYTGPFVLDKSATVKAISVKDGNIMGEPESMEAVLHKARGAKITVDPEPTGKYSSSGAYTLIDTEFGGSKWGNGKWLGILSRDFVTTIEFDEATDISKVGFNCIEETGAGIYFPESIEVSVSDDGENYKAMNTWRSNRKQPIDKTSDIYVQTIPVEFEKTNCKFLKIKCNYQRVPDSGVFVFVDEIVVE